MKFCSWVTAMLCLGAACASVAEARPKASSGPAPTLDKVSYGPNPREMLRFWKAASDKPTPVLIFVHGGSWMKGDWMEVDRRHMLDLLSDGISVVSIQYRFISDARKANINPPVQWPLEDAARAVQFVRSKAKEWGLDPTRVALSGVSAGSCSSLWVALHDDMANPSSSDPVARESTRVTCAAVFDAQTTLDPVLTRSWIPNAVYGGHAFGHFEGDTPAAQFENFCKARDQLLPLIRQYSPMELASADDPPIYCAFDTKFRPVGKPQADPTHSPVFGLKLKEKLTSLGVECHVTYHGAPADGPATVRDFLVEKLKGPASKPKK